MPLMNPRDIDQLTTAERISAIVRGFIATEESYLQEMAHRERLRERRRLIDECEHVDDQKRSEAALCELCAAPEGGERPEPALPAAQPQPVRRMAETEPSTL